MNNTATIKDLLGLNQEEMAMTLGITTSQWSMFKSGKRDLPLQAKLQFATLLENIQKKKQLSLDVQKLIKAERQRTIDTLKQEHLKVQLKPHRIDKKLSIVENRRTECFAALETVTFLENQKTNQPIENLANSIRIRVTTTLKKHNLFQLTELQLKKENFEMLKKQLEQKIKEISNEL
ncbi:hypothetical protein [Flavobacterium sp.]|uniref:hypothetical protein n=1 Tax=Flavobacterium sp. TaxID=239 RepID=UPI00262D3290|nr:hypothetical protein [Flavobacterium sp.]